MIDYADNDGLDGQEENMGGTKQVIYYAPVRDFLSIKVPNPAASTPDAVVKITDTHTFKVGFCFKKLYCTLDKGQVDIEPQGERDGKSVKTVAKIFHPGAKAEVFGFASLAKNDKFIAIIPMADGTNVQIGSADFYAEISPKFGSSTNSGGTRGHEFEVSSMNPKPLIYTGVISTTPAV